MANIRVSVREKLGELTRRMKEFVPIFQDESEKELQEIGAAFVSVAQKYPPENDGNRPPAPYWQRGVGRIGVSGKVTQYSENMKGGWAYRTANEGGDPLLTIRNPTTYAPWVHGDRQQAWFHERNGWPTISEIGDEIGVPSLTDAGVSVEIGGNEPRALKLKERITQRIRGMVTQIRS